MSKFSIALLFLLSVALLSANVSILEQSPNHLLLQYTIEPYSIDIQEGLTYIHTDKMNYSSIPGSPLLPYQEYKIVIPEGGGITVNILDIATETQTLTKQVLPVPDVSSVDGYTQYTYNIKQDTYAPSNFSLVQTLAPATFRGFTYQTILINPFNYDGYKSLKIAGSILIRIDISGNTAQKSSYIGDDLSSGFLAQVLNPDSAKNWNSKLRGLINFADWSKSDNWIRIETDKDGIYKITPTQLGVSNQTDIDPQTFRLFTTGGDLLSNNVVDSGKLFSEVPIMVVGEEDNDFGTNDYILFYGTNRNGLEKNSAIQASLYHNPYSLNTVYWLTYGSGFSGVPLRIANSTAQTSWASEITNIPVQIRVEEEVHRREVEDFKWYMSKFFGQGNSQYQYQINLEDVDTDTSGSFIASLIQENAASVQNHRISISINGSLLYNPGITDSTMFSWGGSGEYIVNEATRYYVNGNNDIRINAYRSGTDNIYLDYLIYEYQKRLIKRNSQYLLSISNGSSFLNTKYNFTGNNQDVSVFQINSIADINKIPVTNTSNGFYFVSSGATSSQIVVTQSSDWLSPALVQKYSPMDLTDTGTQIDNLIVCPPEFIEQAESLKIFYWDNYQIRSKVVTQEQIFDQFNGGHPDPAAIKQYVRYAYQAYLAPHLSSMTLLGTGTIDWRNFSNQAAEKNKVMVYQKGRDVSDDYLAMINTPLYPEIAIGRYPVKNANELNTMLSNMRNYAENPTPGWWRNSMLFVADDLYNGTSSSNEYIHTQQAQSSASQVNPSILTDKVYGMEYDYDEFQNKPKAREDMFNFINDGTLSWLYIGHGSFDKLGAEDYLDGASDLVRFNNTGKLPLFIAASCQIAHFDYWGYDSLAQKLVMMNNLGAIASIAGTRETYPYNNAPLTNAFLNQSINLRNRLGYSLLTAKIIYTQNNSNDEKYIIFGDPLLQISPPERDSTFNLYVNEELTDTLQSRQLSTAEGTFSGVGLQGTAEIQAFNSETLYNLGPNTDVSKRGGRLFKGTATVENSRYSSSFVVPDDVVNGNSSKIVGYMWDDNSKKDYINYSFPITLSDEAVLVENTDVPAIDIYMDIPDFRNGDTVGTHPVLYAKISDENGINITGSPGHNILLILDNSNQPLSVTDYFAYDLDSHTIGTLTYPMSDLTEGTHTIQLIAFDNFNSPSVANANFLVKKVGDLAIERLLPYPNPMAKDGHITFILSQNADVTIGIYTMSGKKIRTFKAIGKAGFNQIYWDGKDGDGDRLANNTYFVKVKAKNAGKSIEKTERIVIYK